MQGGRGGVAPRPARCSALTVLSFSAACCAMASMESGETVMKKPAVCGGVGGVGVGEGAGQMCECGCQRASACARVARPPTRVDDARRLHRSPDLGALKVVDLVVVGRSQVGHLGGWWVQGWVGVEVRACVRAWAGLQVQQPGVHCACSGSPCMHHTTRPLASGRTSERSPPTMQAAQVPVGVEGSTMYWACSCEEGGGVMGFNGGGA